MIMNFGRDGSRSFLVCIALVSSLLVFGCVDESGQSAKLPNQDERVYFVSSLYGGDLFLPGMEGDPMNASASTTHEYQPAGIKFGSGQMFHVDKWTTWTNERAVGAGMYVDHQWVKSQGNVILDQPEKCGDQWTFTHLRMSLTTLPSDTPDASWSVPEVHITTC